MDTIFDYIHWIGEYNFDVIQPNSVDSLILSSLCYVKFERFYKNEETIEEISKRILIHEFSYDWARVENDFKLLKELSNSKRFGQLFVHTPQSISNKDTQFASVVFHDEKRVFICFRGTDATLVGWKEDFNMSFMESIPADIKGLEYLKNIASEFKKERIYISGHSKGGHIAQYSFIFAPLQIKNRVESCYSFDGPGFSSLPQESFQDNRLKSIVPDSSIIGMLLCHNEEYEVVKSSAFLIMQHDPYSWSLNGSNFLFADRSRASIYFDSVTHSLLESIPVERRERLIDVSFDILSSAHSDSFHGLTSSIMKNLPEISSKLASLNKEDKEMVIAVAKKLGGIMYKELRNK